MWERGHEGAVIVEVLLVGTKKEEKKTYLVLAFGGEGRGW
jgi:hypothetical protein